jgi:hypothetical protein
MYQRLHLGLMMNTEFLVMSFGLTNALSTFQGLMNEVFTPHLRKCVLVFYFIFYFFNDTLVYNLKDHLKHLKAVLKILQLHQLYAKISKC